MKNTTQCYIEKDGKYLMLHRTKKQNDENEGKYVGIGGKFEAGESAEECVLREVLEETGLILKSCSYKGIVTFISDIYETENMHLFYSDDFSGDIISCDEGDLCFVDKRIVSTLPIWEGDKIFLDLLLKKDLPFFYLTLSYSGNKLVKAVYNNTEISLPYNRNLFGT